MSQVKIIIRSMMKVRSVGRTLCMNIHSAMHPYDGSVFVVIVLLRKSSAAQRSGRSRLTHW